MAAEIIASADKSARTAVGDVTSDEAGRGEGKRGGRHRGQDHGTAEGGHCLRGRGCAGQPCGVTLRTRRRQGEGAGALASGRRGLGCGGRESGSGDRRREPGHRSAAVVRRFCGQRLLRRREKKWDLQPWTAVTAVGELLRTRTGRGRGELGLPLRTRPRDWPRDRLAPWMWPHGLLRGMLLQMLRDEDGEGDWLRGCGRTDCCGGCCCRYCGARTALLRGYLLRKRLWGVG